MNARHILNFAAVRKGLDSSKPMNPRVRVFAQPELPTKEELEECEAPLVYWFKTEAFDSPEQHGSMVDRLREALRVTTFTVGNHLPRQIIHGVHAHSSQEFFAARDLNINVPHWVEDRFGMPVPVMRNGDPYGAYAVLGLYVQQLSAALQNLYRVQGISIFDRAHQAGIASIALATKRMIDMTMKHQLRAIPLNQFPVDMSVTDAGQPGDFSIILSVNVDAGLSLDHVELFIRPMTEGVQMMTSAHVAQTLHHIYPHLFVERPRYANSYEPKEA